MKLHQGFTRLLKADALLDNYPRRVMDATYSFVLPKGMKQPNLIIHSKELATEMGLSDEFCQSEAFVNLMSGNAIAEGSKPFAMCYGGHQFGHWAGQLGDGRAINLGNISHGGKNFELQLKGAGPTPYARTADGFAVLRSSIREFLCSEAMHYLGIPTTRALSLIRSGEEVLRDIMYDGNPSYEPGAVVCRVAPSFVRFGNFEIHAANQNKERLKELTDFMIDQHFPELSNNSSKYADLLARIADLTCQMVVHWQRVGFVHGVMNTDNMSVLGLTIDYGPYGWLDDYNPDWTPNTTDLPGKRYKFGNQPIICQWNLIRLANALYYLTEESDKLESIIRDFHTSYQQRYLEMMRSKLGLQTEFEDDASLISGLENTLLQSKVDMTIFFRNLSYFDPKDVRGFINDFIRPALYDPTRNEGIQGVEMWLNQYAQRLEKESWQSEERVRTMQSVNPKYILRNYMAQLAIEEAHQCNYTLIHELHELLKHPYEEQKPMERWFALRPEWAEVKIGCSMLSCSS